MESSEVRAAIYVRQSEDVKEGIERGIARCESLLKARGWALVETYADNAVSASKSRTATRWAQMLEGAAAGRFTHVIGVDIDRLVRSIQDLSALIDLGLKVVTVDGEIDLSTADGEFRATMLAAIARFEVRRKGERQVRANSHARGRGLPSTGKKRLGYLGADKATGRRANVKADPETAPIVVDLFERVLAGESIYSLAKAHNMRPVVLRDVLRNRAYLGEIPVGTYERDPQTGKKRLTGRTYIEGSAEIDRLIDRDTFEAVQALLSDPSRKTSPGSQRRHVASGIIHCGECGAKMKAMHKAYTCVADRSHPYIKREFVHEVLSSEVLGFVLNLPDPEDSEEVKALLLERSEEERKRAKLQEIATWEGADVDGLKRQIQEQGKRVAALSARIDATRVRSVTDSLVIRLKDEMTARQDDHSINADEELSAIWDGVWEALSFDEKRLLIGLLDIRVNLANAPERITVKVK